MLFETFFCIQKTAGNNVLQQIFDSREGHSGKNILCIFPHVIAFESESINLHLFKAGSIVAQNKINGWGKVRGPIPFLGVSDFNDDYKQQQQQQQQ